MGVVALQVVVAPVAALNFPTERWLAVCAVVLPVVVLAVLLRASRGIQRGHHGIDRRLDSAAHGCVKGARPPAPTGKAEGPRNTKAADHYRLRSESHASLRAC